MFPLTLAPLFQREVCGAFAKYLTTATHSRDSPTQIPCALNSSIDDNLSFFLEVKIIFQGKEPIA